MEEGGAARQSASLAELGHDHGCTIALRGFPTDPIFFATPIGSYPNPVTG